MFQFLLTSRTVLCCGPVASMLDSGSSSLNSIPGWGHCTDVFYSWVRYFALLAVFSFSLGIIKSKTI